MDLPKCARDVVHFLSREAHALRKYRDITSKSTALTPCFRLAGKPDCQPPASGSLSGPGFEPSKSSAPLLENGFEVHPDTPRDDPVYGLLGITPV
jgi:hypothetical protein